MVQPEFPVRRRAPAPGRKYHGKALPQDKPLRSAPGQLLEAPRPLFLQQAKHHNQVQAGKQAKPHQRLETEAVQPGNGCG